LDSNVNQGIQQCSVYADETFKVELEFMVHADLQINLVQLSRVM